jgi:cold shock CspA family protein
MGTIVRFGGRGYGWIRTDEGQEVFFHASSVVTIGPDGRPLTPYPRDRCRFVIVDGERGSAARNVQLLDLALSGDENEHSSS